LIAPRNLLALAALVAIALALAACGGGSNGGGEDPQKVLDETFSPKANLESADVDASFSIDVEGANGGHFDASLSGPIDSRGQGVPKFDLTAKVSGEGGGQNIDFEGGVTSTGDAGYISYGGTDYKLTPQVFGFLKQIIANAQGQQSTQQQSGVPSIKTFLTNLKDEGTEDVEGTDTNHVSGEVDVQKLVDVLKPYAQRAGSLGAAGAQIPSPAELDQLTQILKNASFDLYSGTDDHLLRRLTLDFELQPPGGSGKATIALDVTLGSVNEPQTVEAPSNPKPLRDLLQQFGIGNLGSLGLPGALPGSSAGGGGGSSGMSAAQIQCLQQATTPAQLQKCVQ
jgi:hypothetical protein